MPDDFETRVFSKELWVIAPVIGSAIAITYDVGYFTALDINLFTVFSISEHIAFALEVLPLAILATVILVVGPIAWESGRRSGAVEARQEIATGKKQQFYKKKFFWFQVLFFFWLVGLGYFYRSASSIALLVIYTVTTILAELFPMQLYLRPIILVGLSAFAGLTLAFTIGMDVANAYRDSNNYRYTVKTGDAELKAKVVRSGERGLLFHDEASKQLLLLPWSEIKRISSSRV
jgi:hypothetical protein